MNVFGQILWLLSAVFGVSPAEAQTVQRECRPQVVQTDSVLLRIIQFPSVYNARHEEVACCDADGGNAFVAGQVYVQIQHDRTAGDPPISCSGGAPILVAQDIAGPAERGDAPSSWPFIRRSTFFQAIRNVTPGWNGQGFVGVQRSQIIEYACAETDSRTLTVALIDCPCGVSPSGHCNPRPSLNSAQPPSPIVPGGAGQAGNPGNQLLVPQTPVAPSR